MRVDAELQLQKNEWKIPSLVENNKESNSVKEHTYIKVEIGTGYETQSASTQLENSVENISKQAENMDVELQKNYRTVMSSCMTSEDYAKLEENGYSLSDMNMEELVTVTDQIKAELIKAGVTVTGYTDTIDQEKLKELTGSEAYAQKLVKKMQQQDLPVNNENVNEYMKAYQMQSDIGKLTENAKKYILENKLEPTISNLYFAVHSSGSKAIQITQSPKIKNNTTMDSHSSTINFDKIQKQISNIVNNTVFKNDSDTDAEAKWLIQNEIALNEENLENLHNLNHYEDYMDEDSRMNSIIAAISSGKNGSEAIFYNTCNIYEKALDTLNQVDSITETDVVKASEVFDVLSLKKIVLLKEQNEKTDSNQKVSSEEHENYVDKKGVAAKRQLEEIRLKMSLEVNIRLLRKGVSIDTINLNRLVEELKVEEEKLAKVFLPGNEIETSTEQYREYKTTIDVVNDFKKFPASVVGISVMSPGLTINALYQEGLSLQNAYTKAGISYEKMMTSPRSDYGDSIKTAFRNIPDLLSELGMENTQKNQRAVRILAYSHMDVTQENIENVKMRDLEISTLIDKMTPSTVLKMVKEGIQPLQMKLSEVSDYLNSVEPSISNEAENYARFLYRLEQNNEVTQEEKDAYIGIYRLMRQIEKSDGALLGHLISQGAEVSFKNLLSAMRTEKAKGVDVRVNNSDPIPLQRTTDSSSISIQLGEKEKVQFQKNIAFEIRSKIEKAMTIEELPNDTESLEIFQEEISKQDLFEEQTVSTTHNDKEQIQKAIAAETELIAMLDRNEIPVTVRNLNAIEQMMYHMGNQYRSIQSKEKGFQKNKMPDSKHEEKEKEVSSTNQLIQSAQESLTDHNSMVQAFEKIQEYTEELIDNEMNSNNSLLDIRSMSLTFAQVKLGTALAKQDVYEVPVLIGEELTSVRLTMIHDKSDSGTVTITMDTEHYGKVSAKFDLNENQVNGYLIYNNASNSDQLRKVLDHFDAQLKQRDIQLNRSQVQLIEHDTPEIQISEIEKNKEEVSSQQLYFVAKSFIYSIQK